MLARRLIVVALLFGLSWPVAAAIRECTCSRNQPVKRACCPGSKPDSGKENGRKGCCTIVPDRRAKGEAVETVRSAPPDGPKLPIALTQASLPALARCAPEMPGPAHGGDPPGEPPRIHLSNCTFRI